MPRPIIGITVSNKTDDPSIYESKQLYSRAVLLGGGIPVLLPQQIGSDIADVVRDDPLRVNFIRLKKEHALYLESTNGTTFLTPTVFRAEIPLPAQAPFGNYDVEVKVFSERALLVRNTTAFEIVKAGFEQFVANAARDYSFLYGLFAAAMAIATGWFASVVFRRD